MIVVVGEALMDLVAQGTEAMAALRPYVGGSPTNAALAIAAQGQKVAYLGQLADDTWGEHIFQTFQQAGVNTDYLQRSSSHSTSLALAQLGEDGSSRYTFYLGEAADLQLPRNFSRPASAQVQAVMFGSYSIGIPSFRAAVEPYLWQMSQSALVAFDPNIRPQLLPPAAEYRGDWQRWLELCDLVKLSEEDLEWLLGQDAEEQLISACFAARPTLVLVSRGAGGATLYHRRGTKIDFSMPVPQVVDTIGSGDTLHGAMLAFLSRRGCLSAAALATLGPAELGELLRWSVGAAALNCTRPGCSPPTSAEIEEFIRVNA